MFGGDKTSPQDGKANKRKLRVRAGPSIDTLTTINPNEEDVPHYIDSPYFVGYVVVRIKSFDGITPDGCTVKQADGYFGTKKRLFAVQICGRFKHECPVDDVLFGTEFERKCSPPTGSWIAIKFANLIDPALQADIYADQPWLMSPILCSMNVVNVKQATHPVGGAATSSSTPSSTETDATVIESVYISTPSSAAKAVPSPQDLLGEWLWKNGLELTENNSLLGDSLPFDSDAISDRRKYFNKPKARKNALFKPNLIYNFEVWIQSLLFYYFLTVFLQDLCSVH